jgi:hypothetical protein
MIQELLKNMGPSAENVIQEIESLTEKTFKTHIITGTWTTKEILAHIAAWDLIFTDMSKKMANGELLPEKPDFDALNAQEVEKRQHLTRADLIEEVRKNRKAYINYLASLTEDQLTDKTYSFTILELAESIVSHDNHHLQQIKAR